MPIFKVIGIGKTTRRKRTRYYDVKDESAVAQKATSEDTEIFSIERLPDPPPTPASERQTKYATDLGLSFPADISSESISRLIDAHLTGATDRQELIIGLIEAGRTATVRYKKYGEAPTDRLVVPLCLEKASGDALAVFCLQLDPKPDREPWRSFRLDRICAISDGGQNANKPELLKVSPSKILSCAQAEVMRRKLDRFYISASVAKDKRDAGWRRQTVILILAILLVYLAWRVFK